MDETLLYRKREKEREKSVTNHVLNLGVSMRRRSGYLVRFAAPYGWRTKGVARHHRCNVVDLALPAPLRGTGSA